MSDHPVVRTYVIAEVDRMYTERRNFYIVGGLVVLLVFGYMTWLDRQVAYFTQPEHFALTASGMLEAQLPALERTAEDMIVREAPHVARYLGDSVTREVPVLLRDTFQRAVMEYTAELATLAVIRYRATFDAVLAKADEGLAAAVAAPDSASREILVAQALRKEIDAAVIHAKEGDIDADPLLTTLDQSHRALANLHKRLAAIAARKPDKMGRSDRLTRRFLGTFWRFVQQRYPDSRAAD